MNDLTEHSKFNVTDAGNAKRFVAEHGVNIRYISTRKCWMFWNGKYWEDDINGHIERLGKETAISIYQESHNVMGQALKANTKTERDILNKEAQDIGKWAKNSESKKHLSAMISLAKSEQGITVSQNEFNKDIWLINCKNGTVDLRSGDLRKHNRGDFISRIIDVDYDPTAKAPLFEKFLEKMLPEKEVRNFLQRWVGYSLTGDVSEQFFLMFLGSGANGKSTFVDVILSLFRQYSKQTEFRTFIERDSETVRNDIARLERARLVFASEGKHGSKLDSSIIKTMTGDDVVTCRYLYGEYFEYKPQYKIILTTNHKPVIDDSSNGMWRRFLLLNWPVSLAPEERDKALLNKLKLELEGILSWAIKGTKEWLTEGLCPPQSILSATDEYKDSQDEVGYWVREYCKESVNTRTSSSELYNRYKAWCDENEVTIVSQRKLSEELRSKGFSPIKGTGGKREWLGVKLDKNEMNSVVEAQVAEVASSSVNTTKHSVDKNKNADQLPLVPLEPFNSCKENE